MRMLTNATDKPTPIDLKQYLSKKPASKTANLIVLTKMPDPVPNTSLGKQSFDTIRTSMAGQKCTQALPTSAEGGMRTRLKKGLLARKKRAERLRMSDPS